MALLLLARHSGTAQRAGPGIPRLEFRRSRFRVRFFEAPRNDESLVGEIAHALFGWKLGWMTVPSLVSAVALTSSSSQLTASALAFLSTMVSMNENRLRA